MTIAHRLRAAREARGLTPQDAADLIGIPLDEYRAVESGAQTPTDPFLVAFCRSLGIAPADLLGDNGRPDPPDQDGYRVLGSGLTVDQNALARVFTAVFGDEDNHRGGTSMPDTWNDAIRHIFREQMALMVRKQQDYGPGNINAFGELGLVVRLSDKIERLKHLLFETAPTVGWCPGPPTRKTNRSRIRTGTSSTTR
ncbi:MAG: helix-turn-helix transcriptional regulator [Sulfobacillus sp.]|nr:helix-turn-helix transcriptional regulator [Sulfobacillus sp.]